MSSLLIRLRNVKRELEISQISTWIRQALLCKAHVLRLQYDEPDCHQLKVHNLHLVSHHLMTLELKCVRLENGFLDFSSCLTLKNLWMMGCHIWAEKLSSRSLKQLTIIHCYFKGHIWTRISTPNLVWLELSNNHRKTTMLESVPSLVKALVRLRDCLDHCGKEEFWGSCSRHNCNNCGHTGEESQDCVLLKGLSQAANLELVAGPRTVCLCLPFFLQSSCSFDHLFLLTCLYHPLAQIVAYVFQYLCDHQCTAQLYKWGWGCYDRFSGSAYYDEYANVRGNIGSPFKWTCYCTLDTHRCSIVVLVFQARHVLVHNKCRTFENNLVHVLWNNT